jgi:phosphoadenosine phosphosulfate reductase
MNPDSLSPRLQSLVQNTRATLELAVREYGDVVYSNSLGAEAMVLTDILCTYAPEIEMFTLDTGRLPDETLALLDRIERRYQRRIEVYYPDA